MRNTIAMRASPRCGAKTRKATSCLSPAVSGKLRCRMHGGATGSGAPKGNTNALKGGLYNREAVGELRQLRELLKDARDHLKSFKT